MYLLDLVYCHYSEATLEQVYETIEVNLVPMKQIHQIVQSLGQYNDIGHWRQRKKHIMLLVTKMNSEESRTQRREMFLFKVTEVGRDLVGIRRS